MTPFAACTIVSASHLARAAVLSDTLMAVHPEMPLHVLVIDSPPREVDVPREMVRLRRDQLPLSDDEYLDMAALYSPLELSCALKPFVVRALLAQGAQRVLYLDADVMVLGDLSSFAREADESGLVLTPHIKDLPIAADGTADVEGVVLGSGLMNLGMFAVTPKAEEFLLWWSNHLRRECVDDLPRQRFVDQRWVDVALTCFPHAVCRDPGVNSGWWSLGSADLDRAEDGALLVEGVALRALHLSGFSPEKPYLLSDHAGARPRTLTSDTPLLGSLLGSYAARLLNAGDRKQRKESYGFSVLADGTPYDSLMRLMFREALLDAEAGFGERPPNPFAAHGPSAFFSWLAFPTGALGASEPLPRYLSALYAVSPEVQAMFPAVAGKDAAGFLAWCDTPERGLRPILRRLDDHCTQWADDSEPATLVIVAEATRAISAEASSVPDAITAAFAEATTSTERLDALLSGEPAPGDRRRLGNRPPSVDAAVVVGDLTAIPPLHHASMSAASAAIPRIAFAHWHGTCAPTGSGDAVQFLDGLAVPSAFSSAALTAAGAPLATPVGLPVRPAHSRGARRMMGLEDAFLAYAPVDLDDDGRRHDVGHVVDAFRLLASTPRITALVIGLRGASEHIVAAERIRWLARESGDIHVVDVPLGPPDLDPWLVEADVVLALHRTEGFAWSAATAMASRTPVVATRFGGNLDYMTDGIALLVDPSAFDEVGSDLPGMATGSALAVLEPELIASAIEQVRHGAGRIDLAHAREVVLSSYAPPVVAGRLLALAASAGERDGPAAAGEDSGSRRFRIWRQRR